LPVERTLVLVKPDGMQRGLASEILGRLERRGLKLAGLKLLRVSRGLAEQHYAEHKGKDFYEGLLAFITSAPVIAAVFEGEGAIAAVRQAVGKTNPLNAEAGTIRGDLALEPGFRNLVHASDTEPGSAQREVALWFGTDELVSWTRDVDRWVAG
jgi:nucleoside-diphosphate kinase